MKFETTDLFGKMLTHFIEQYKLGKKAKITNIGGSRSGKTIQTAMLLLFLADKYRVKTYVDENGESKIKLTEDGSENLIIDVYRNELKRAKKTFEDFMTTISLMEIGNLVKCSSPNSDRPSITLPNGNIINFYGLPDDGKPVEASKSHIVYFNEALEISSYNIISNVVLRCELMVIFDSNPSATTHWLFDMANKDKEMLNTHTIYRHNRFLPKSLIEGIEELCPYDLSDFIYDEKNDIWVWRVPESQRKPNTRNLERKTANKRNWLIYGEGLRCAREGQAFEGMTFIEQFPNEEQEDIQFDFLIYGLDFGWTNDETALVRVGVSGSDIYVKLLYYRQCPKSDLLFAELESIFIKEEEFLGGKEPTIDVVCESQDNKNGDYFVSSLNYQKREHHNNWNFFKVKKPKFRSYSVDLVNTYNLYVVRNEHTETEFLNFVYEERNGELTAILHGTRGRNNHDHAIDAMLYACWETLKFKVN